MLSRTEPVVMAIGETEIIVKMVIDMEIAVITNMIAEENVAIMIGITE